MSEYQYYEFQTIEHRLSPQEQSEIQKLSSRVQLTPTQAIFIYNYGDFRGDPEKVLTKYFDVMFYIANWGTWRLMFKFPKGLVDPKLFEPYNLTHAITIKQSSDYIILDLLINEEEGIGGWVEGEGWLPRLLPLRDELLTGDLRLLYLVWLRVAPNLAGSDLDEEPLEPPIPPNLSQLNQAHLTFIELVELDSDLVAAAAEASLRHQSTLDPPLENWLVSLSEAERQEFLLKLVRRESHVDLQLINRLRELAGTNRAAPPLAPGHRRLSELEARAEILKTKRQQQEQKAARKKRIQQLEALAPKEEQIWNRVVELIGLKQAKPYDEATALLKELRDLSEHQGRLPEFVQRFEKLKSDYTNRPALIKRFQKIKL